MSPSEFIKIRNFIKAYGRKIQETENYIVWKDYRGNVLMEKAGISVLKRNNHMYKLKGK